jgi:hypothetical protein
MTKRNPEQLLQEALHKLPRDIQPARDLWPGIAHALQAPAPSPWYRQAALAASILLVLSLSLYYGALQPVQPLPNSLIEEFLGTLQSEHELSKQSLLVRYQDEEAYYPDWEQQLQQLEQAEGVIFQALRDDPDNLELVKILRQVQDKQMKLIEAVFDPRLRSI